MGSKAKKIISISVLSVISLLIIAVIVLALVPVYKGAVFANTDGTFTDNDKPDIISVRTDSSNIAIYYKDKASDKDMYNKLWDAYIDAGSYKLLDTLFIEKDFASKTAGPNRLSSYSDNMTTLYDSSDEYCLIFEWYEGRTMMNSDGTIYKPVVDDTTYTPDLYKRACISITADNEIKETNIYLLSSLGKSGTTKYVYQAYLNTYNLYNTVSGMTYQPA